MGFTYDRLQKEFSSYFFPMFSKASIEEEGCFIVTDQSGKIVAPVAGHDDAKGKTMMDFGLQKSEWE